MTVMWWWGVMSWRFKSWFFFQHCCPIFCRAIYCLVIAFWFHLTSLALRLAAIRRRMPVGELVVCGVYKNADQVHLRFTFFWAFFPIFCVEQEGKRMLKFTAVAALLCCSLAVVLAKGSWPRLQRMLKADSDTLFFFITFHQSAAPDRQEAEKLSMARTLTR